MIQFSFPKSPFALNSVPTPQDNPISHLLPPEPFVYKNPKKSNAQSFQNSEEKRKSGYIDITLGNSPEFIRTLEPPKPSKSISNFNKKVGQTYKKVVSASGNDSNIQILIIPESTSRSRQKQLHSTIHKQEVFSEPREKLFPNAFTQEKSLREKQSRASKRTYQEGESSRFGNSLKNPRQENIYAGDHVKKKFTNRIDKGSSPQNKKKLVQTIQELMVRVVDLQNTNKTLLPQLQIARQKLRVRQSENNLLKSKNKEYQAMMDQWKEAIEVNKKLEDEITHLKGMNQLFCEEISQLKEQIIKNEDKKQQSLKLLQQLNENITKRQQKLQKQLQQQLTANSELKNETQQLNFVIAGKNVQLLELQKNLFSLQEDLKKQKQENERLSQIIEAKKAVEAQNQFYKKQISDLTSQLRQCEKKIATLIIQLRSKSEQCVRLNQQLDSLKDQIKRQLERFQSQKQVWRKQMNQKNQEIEHLKFKIKELEMRITYLNQEARKKQEEIKDLKDQKRLLYVEKQQLKADCNNLLKKNDELLERIQDAKHLEIQLKEVISDYQKNVIQLEQRISQNISKLSDNQMELKRLRQLLEIQKAKNIKLTQEIQIRDRKILSLEQSIQKEIKVSTIYKQGLSRLQEKKDQEWHKMNNVYNDQIKELQQKIRQLIEYNDSKSKLLNKKNGNKKPSVTDNSRYSQMLQSQNVDHSPGKYETSPRLSQTPKRSVEGESYG